MWDWPYILYIGRVWLKYTDDEILAMTPKKFKAQLDMHWFIQGLKKQEEATTGFIDQLAGW